MVHPGPESAQVQGNTLERGYDSTTTAVPLALTISMLPPELMPMVS
jgi:hypothetical protein